MEKTPVQGTTLSSKAPKPVGLYPHARQAGDFLFLSGIGSREPGTDRISDDFEEQCRQVFENVKTVLADAGSQWENVIDVTVYLTNMQRDFSTFNKIYAEQVHGMKDKPCRTTVEVGSLPTPIAVELKCVAWMGKRP